MVLVGSTCWWVRWKKGPSRTTAPHPSPLSASPPPPCAPMGGLVSGGLPSPPRLPATRDGRPPRLPATPGHHAHRQRPALLGGLAPPPLTRQEHRPQWRSLRRRGAAEDEERRRSAEKRRESRHLCSSLRRRARASHRRRRSIQRQGACSSALLVNSTHTFAPIDVVLQCGGGDMAGSGQPLPSHPSHAPSLLAVARVAAAVGGNGVWRPLVADPALASSLNLPHPSRRARADTLS